MIRGIAVRVRIGLVDGRRKRLGRALPFGMDPGEVLGEPTLILQIANTMVDGAVRHVEMACTRRLAVGFVVGQQGRDGDYIVRRRCREIE